MADPITVSAAADCTLTIKRWWEFLELAENPLSFKEHMGSDLEIAYAPTATDSIVKAKVGMWNDVLGWNYEFTNDSSTESVRVWYLGIFNTHLGRKSFKQASHISRVLCRQTCETMTNKSCIAIIYK